MIFRHLLNMRSHPTWVRGLKQTNNYGGYCIVMSHPTWVRGLKRDAAGGMLYCSSRTLRGCVD